MRPVNSLLCVAMAALLVAVASDTEAAKPVKPTKPAPPKPAGKGGKPKVDPKIVLQDAALMAALKSAHQVLDTAAVSYGGHRKKAMAQVAFAVVDLEREIHKRGHKPRPHSYTVPGNPSADGLMQLAQTQLVAVGTQLGNLAPSPLRNKTGNHVKGALAEVAHALALAKDHAIVHQLRVAHKTLAKADPIYAGHRGAAMNQINAAIADLERELHARGMKDHTKHLYKEPTGVSDLQVKQTQAMLVQALKAMANLPSTGWRQAAGGHVTAAIHELHKALAVARDHILVAELRSIYKLIDKADGIYQGHRVKAMAEINHAIGNLEKEMAVHGLKAHHHKHAWEPESVSNWQIKHAHKQVKHVEAKLALMPTSVHRKKADAHLKSATSQLVLALKVAPSDQK